MFRANPGAMLMGCLLCVACSSSAQAYITNPVQTLGELSGSTYITVVRVEKVSKEKGIIVYKKVSDLKGKYPKDVIKHVFDLKNTPAHTGPGDVPVRPDEKDWQYAIKWAEAGKTAVMFTRKYDPFGDFGHTYIDGCWYATMCPRRDWEFWYSIYSDPALLNRWHCGTPAQLASAMELVLAGKEAIVPVVVKGTKDDLRIGRAKIQGLKIGVRNQDYKPERDLVVGWVEKEMMPGLIKSLPDATSKNRAHAVRLLGMVGPAAKDAVPGLTTLLQDKDAEVRKAALMALESIGADVKGAEKVLIELLKEPEVFCRLQAAEMLAQKRRAEPEVLAVAIGLFEDPKSDQETRLRCVRILGQLGPGAAPAVPVLIKTMKNPDRGMRITAAELLAQLGPLAKAAVSVLADAVGNDVSGTVRMRAAEALARIGPDAKSAAPALKAALADPRIAKRAEVLAKIAEVYEKLK